MPPQRKQRVARDSQSVYPPREITATLGGWRSVTMTQGLRCWAKVLERASLEVADLLGANEWNYVSHALAGKEWQFDPDMDNPGELLAQLVERARNYETGLQALSKDFVKAKKLALDLAERLRAMDYIHAWALIWAVQFRAELVAKEQEAPDSERWWTLGYRQTHAQ